MPDHNYPNDWVQTRRRVDWMLGSLCLFVAIAGVITYQVTNQWTAFPSVTLACGIWFWFRLTILPNGQAHSKARIRHDHAFMILMGAIGLPTFLAIFAVDWLGLPYAAWLYAGIFAMFLGAVLGGGGWIHRQYRRSIEASQLSLDSPPNEPLSTN